MNQTWPAAKPAPSRWPTILAVCVIVAIIALTAYASITIYGMVRRYVAASVQLPSFATLSRQAGLNLGQPSAGQPGPAAPNVAAPADATPGAAPATQAAVGAPAAGSTPAVQPDIPSRVTILLMGIDQRQGEAGPFRTDTMIVLTLDPATGAGGMLSIPRDLWLPIPGYGENRINTANFLGDLMKYPGGGPALAKKTVTHNFGFPVHYYVRLNFEGFKRIIDTIGGIDINVESEIRDDLYPDENYGYDPLYIPAGLVHMNGELALKYARTRHNDSDIYRAGRQQQVIMAVVNKVFSLNLLPSLLPKLPELSRTLADAIQTDMPLDEMIRLARMMLDMDYSKVKQAVIDDTMTMPNTTPQGASVLLPIREKIRPVVDELFWTTAVLP
jgi:LCP family protein required for cell wall assembly